MNEHDKSDRIVRIRAVGDVCPGDKTIAGLGPCSVTRRRGVDFPLARVKESLGGADIVVGNLEGLLVAGEVGAAPPAFAGMPEFAGALARCGFNVLTVANNHSLELGPAALTETIAHLRRAGIAVCGLRNDGSDPALAEFHSLPVFVDVRGTRVGLIGYNWVSVELFPDAERMIAQSSDGLVNYTWHRDPERDRAARAAAAEHNQRVLRDLRLLEERCDVTVLVPHWGYEFVSVPPYGVTLEARTFIDAGADLILGVHPHVLQGYERYRDKWIFYSLGNFVFDMRFGGTRDTAILHYDLRPGGEDSFEFEYLRINGDLQPAPVAPRERERLATAMETSCRAITAQERETTLDDEPLYRAFERAYGRLKWLNVLQHFLEMPRHPVVMLVIARKIAGALSLVAARLAGRKVRW